MLQISQEVLDALAQASREEFVRRAVTFLHGEGLHGAMHQAQLEAWVQKAAESLEAMGINSAQCIVLGLAISLARNINCSADAVLVEALRDLQNEALSFDGFEDRINGRFGALADR